MNPKKLSEITEALPQEINLENVPLVKCPAEGCGNESMVVKVFLHKLSAITAPDGIERTIPMRYFCCEKCGTRTKYAIQ